MTWSLNAHGSHGDPGIAEKLFHELKTVLSKPEYGTMGSQFQGLGHWENDFHLAAEVAADLTAPNPPAPATQEPPAPSSSDNPPVSPAAGGPDGGGGVQETAPSE